MRRVIVRLDSGKELSLLTNVFKASAAEIAHRYKKRWQIELFFKWIKQNLKIRKMFGRSYNAIKTQVCIAMIAYLLLKILHKAVPIKMELLQFTRLIGAHLVTRAKDIWRPFYKRKPPPINNYKLWQINLFKGNLC